MIIVKYQIEGYDHDGYCSGADTFGQDTPDNWINYKLFYDKSEIVSYKKYDSETYHILDIKNDFTDDIFNKDIDIFNDYNDGCTSRGSGYCNGFYQEWKPITVSILNENNKEKFIEEITQLYNDSTSEYLTNNEKESLLDLVSKIKRFFMTEVEKLNMQIFSLNNRIKTLTLKNEELINKLQTISKICTS